MRATHIACLYAAGAAIGIFLLVQHWVHVAPIIPILVLLACPPLHLFLHGQGHRGHEKDGSGSR